MNINPLNFIKLNNTVSSQKNRAIRFETSKDTFVKSSNAVAFKGAETVSDAKSFVEWAQENDFIKTQLDEILFNPENIIGSGFSNTALRIPNNDDYVLRIGTDSLEHSLHKPNIQKATMIDTDDKTDVNVGQKVAEISIPSKWAREGETDYCSVVVEVLKKQNGESIGVQPPETLVTGEYNTRTKDGVAPYEDYSRKEKYISTIKKVAELPVESYEKLIADFQKACEAGYLFDHLNSNNILVDSENKALNLIDMDRVPEGSTRPNYANLLYSLTNISYFSTYTSDYPNPVGQTPEEMQAKKNEALQYNLQIIDKFMQAMKNKGAKFQPYVGSYEFTTKFLYSVPCAIWSQSFASDGFWQKAQKLGVA